MWINQCCYSLLSGHEKTSKLDDFKKIAISKKGIGIKSQKLCKQVNNQKTRNKMELNGFYNTKVKCKAFAIPIPAASAL